MTIVYGVEKCCSILPQGRVGTIKGERPDRQNYPKALARNKWAGIYQRKVTKKGKKISKMPFYIPPNPQTKKQQAWRAIFKGGKIAWDSLTLEQKNSYNKRAIKLKFSGYNLHQREYLHSHKIKKN
jgi:hypothetical protein